MGILSLAGGVIGTIGNLIGVGSTNSANKQINKQNNQFNADEAEKARDFNASEAEKNRQFQQDMYQKSLDWRSPANQLKLMQEAGMNPINFQNGTVSDSAPSGSAASGPAASAAGAIPVQNPFSPAAFSQITEALSNAKLKEKQGNEVDARTATENALRDGKVELQNSSIQLNIANEALTKAQEQKLGKEIIKMDYETNMLMEQIKKVQADTDLVTFQARYQQLKGDEQAKMNARLDERIEEELKGLRIANSLTNEQRKQIIEVTRGIMTENSFKPLTLALGAYEAEAKIGLTDAQRLAVELKTARPETWKRIMPMLNAYGDITEVIGNLLGNAKNIVHLVGK